MSEPAIASLSVADHETKIAELSAGHVSALAAKDGEIAALTEKLTAALSAKDALTASLAKANEDAKAALEKAVADAVAPIKAELEAAKKFDARALGVAPLAVMKAQIAVKSAELSTPEQKLAHYEQITDAKEKSAFRALHWAELTAALSARS